MFNHKPFIHSDAHTKSLHFTYGQLQSRMHTDEPDALVLDYTLTMMGFLLLQPLPQRLLMVGLGGGSLAKYCHRHLPASNIAVVEIDPHVVALRDEFRVPPDSARFRVVVDDGASYVSRAASAFDVLLVDGYDHQGLSPQLGTPAFFAACRRALGPGGLMVMNLHADAHAHADTVARIHQAFEGNALALPCNRRGNVVMLARNGATLSPRQLSERASAWRLEVDGHPQLVPEFRRIAWDMGDPRDLAAVG